jgi:Uma2 family endonuclease
MTETQYLAWSSQNDGVRSEWVDGEVVIMPAVEWAHERISKFVSLLVGLYVTEHDLGVVFGEPYQIRFAKLRRRRMPDLCFVASNRTRHLERMQFDGAPDLAIEIVSTDSQTRDRREKFLEYQEAGVREYWIIDPIVKGVEFYTLKRGKGLVLLPETEGRIESVILPGLFIRPEWFWMLRPPKVLGLLKQMGMED